MSDIQSPEKRLRSSPAVRSGSRGDIDVFIPPIDLTPSIIPFPQAREALGSDTTLATRRGNRLELSNLVDRSSPTESLPSPTTTAANPNSTYSTPSIDATAWSSPAEIHRGKQGEVPRLTSRPSLPSIAAMLNSPPSATSSILPSLNTSLFYADPTSATVARKPLGLSDLLSSSDILLPSPSSDLSTSLTKHAYTSAYQAPGVSENRAVSHHTRAFELPSASNPHSDSRSVARSDASREEATAAALLMHLSSDRVRQQNTGKLGTHRGDNIGPIAGDCVDPQTPGSILGMEECWRVRGEEGY